MVTAEQLETCKKCVNQRLDVNGEIICRLTNKEPDFRGPCIFYESVPGNESVFEEFESEVYLQSAGGGKRFANYIVDSIAMYVFVVLFSLFVFMFADFLGSFMQADGGGSLLSFTISIFSGLTYYTLIEFLTGGRSIGKYITGTKIITLDGEKPDFKTCLVRSLCRYIPFEAFSFFGADDAGWHDSISKTRVVIMKPTV